MKVSSRALKTVIREQLLATDFEAACTAVASHGARRVINILISFYCHPDPLVRWRAIEATGRVVSGHAETHMESARVIMRRFLWMLNDESGGIGWGVPEAMGETMARSESLCAEYHRVFLSYVQPACNFLEHPILQRGLLWGIGRLAQARKDLVIPVLPEISPFLFSDDPYHRGFAAVIFGAAGQFPPHGVPEGAEGERLSLLCRDETEIEVYGEHVIKRKTVGEICRAARPE